MNKRKRETARERDERIVREAGPWCVCILSYCDMLHCAGMESGEDGKLVRRAAARVLNRLRRER